MRYTFLGPTGTFTHEALNQVIDPETDDAVPSIDVPSAIRGVRLGEFDRAVVPIENSIEGGVNATIDALVGEEPLVIVGEALVQVSFNLVARPGTRLEDITRLATHPHAWAQCRGWVAENLPGVVHVPATSTAAAADLLATDEPLDFEAGLVSPLAGERYGLPILAEDVGDTKDAVTRFIVLSRLVPPPPPTGADKTTLQVHLPHDGSGALLTMLEQFSVRGVNLSRIESRPIRGSMGRYAFSIDAEGHIANERVKAVLVGLRRVCPQVTFLGSYPRADRREPDLEPGTSDKEFLAAHRWVDDIINGTAY